MINNINPEKTALLIIDMEKAFVSSGAALWIRGAEEDSLRLYNLRNKYHHKVEHYGVKDSYDPEGELFL